MTIEVKTLSRTDLDKGRCVNPECKGDHETVYLSSDCHVGAPLHCAYVKSEAKLKFICGVCGLPVVDIQLRD
jgi:hypothetical protein